MHAVYFYSARSQVSAEYWKHFTARFDGVHALGYKKRIDLDEIWSTLL